MIDRGTPPRNRRKSACILKATTDSAVFEEFLEQLHYVGYWYHKEWD